MVTSSIADKKNKLYKKKVRNFNKKRTYYIIITIVLILCVAQTIRGACLNVQKYFSLNKQLKNLESINDVVTQKNSDLKKELQNFSSNKGIEELARDNLNMVGKDEVLVLIKAPQKSYPKEKSAL